MKHIVDKFDKHAIPDLPKASFEGRIITIIGESEAEKAVDYLLSQPILGLDTETKPSFKPGARMNKVALLQVSTLDTCFLFRLNQMGFPPCMSRLLGDSTVTKVGLSWHDDLMQLHRKANFQAGTFVELQEMVKLIGIKDLSLQKIYANLFGQKISKSQRLTNWEADNLSQAQQVYAATDAWACIQIYNEIMRLHETKDFELEIIPEPEPPVPTASTDPAKDGSSQERSVPTAGKRSRGRRKSDEAKDSTAQSKRQHHRNRKKKNSPGDTKPSTNNNQE